MSDNNDVNLLAHATEQRYVLKCAHCGEQWSRLVSAFKTETPIIEFAKEAKQIGFRVSRGRIYCDEICDIQDER